MQHWGTLFVQLRIGPVRVFAGAARHLFLTVGLELQLGH